MRVLALHPEAALDVAIPGQLETQCSIWTGWPDGCSVLAGWSFPIAVSGWSAHCYPSGFPVYLAKIKQNLIKIS